MDDKGLVDEILNRVLDKMNSIQPPKAPDHKPKLLILSREHGSRCHELLESTRLLEHYFTEYPLVTSDDCRLEDYEAVILFNLDNNVLSKLSSGICDSPFLNLASKAILNGMKIYVPMEEVELFKYEDTAPKAFYSMMLEKVNFLKSCGMIFCKMDRLEGVIFRKTQREDSVPAIQSSITIHKKVVTEKDVERAHTDGATVICITNKAILSDLAKDYARSRNIRFQRGETLAGKPGICI